MVESLLGSPSMASLVKTGARLAIREVRVFPRSMTYTQVANEYL